MKFALSKYKIRKIHTALIIINAQINRQFLASIVKTFFFTTPSNIQALLRGVRKFDTKLICSFYFKRQIKDFYRKKKKCLLITNF